MKDYSVKDLEAAQKILQDAACKVIREAGFASRFDEMSDGEAILIHAIRRLGGRLMRS